MNYVYTILDDISDVRLRSTSTVPFDAETSKSWVVI